MSLEAIRARIASACEKVGRDPTGVRLLGVAKTFPATRVAELVAAGLQDVGENYVQEARDKKPQVGPCSWHLIGPLQRNKINLALQIFDWIHTLDRLELIRALDDRLQRPYRALLQVRLGDEESKRGVDPEQLFALLESLRSAPLRRLKLAGLMSIPAPGPTPEDSRPHFRRLRELLDEVRRQAYPFWEGAELSMGMSDDFEVAVEEGATIVRIGRALFGAR